jgi:hypothetical protein
MPGQIRFLFAIAFAPRAVCDSWELAQANLRRTIMSIRGISCGEYRIAVACHEIPDLREADGSDVDLLVAPFPVEFEITRRSADRYRKRRLIGAWLRNQLKNDGAYVMFLDADDLVHRNLVNFVHEHDNRRSYIAKTGYIIDCTTGLLARHAGFHATCGSCFVCWFSEPELPRSFDDMDCPYSQFQKHRQFIDVAIRLGKKPDPFPFNAIVYFANHSESQRLKRVGEAREVDLSNLVLPGRASSILAHDFSCCDPQVAGRWGFVYGILAASSRQLCHRVMRYASLKLQRR